MSERTERRLAAVLAADVVGYSRLMGADEAATLAALRDFRGTLFEPLVAGHRGSVVKRMGDGWLVEFAAVADAVSCAIAVQEALAGHQTLKLRVGIHIGDVVFAEEDLYGDGVNIAARLQEAADPGGILISDMAHRSLDGKLGGRFSDRGTRQLKNIAHAVTLFAWDEAVAPSEKDDADALGGKPSIAVLPFDNLSNDPDQEYFADGITEDIITELSRFQWFFVIARNSSFSYKGRSPDIRDVARELGVQYVLEGSVRKAGKRVRVSAQLIEGANGRHVWADKFDRELDDIFAVQDEITGAITGIVAPSFMEAETSRVRRKAPENLESWELVLRGNWHLSRWTSDEFVTAKKFYRRALEIDPENALALSAIAMTSFYQAGGVVGLGADLREVREEGVQAARKALEIDNQDAGAHIALGRVYHIARENDKALEAARTALRLNPNLATAEGFIGLVLAHLGDYDGAQRHAARALRLSPRDPELAYWILARVVAALVSKRYEEYLDQAKVMVGMAPDHVPALRHCAVALVQFGMMEDARTTIARVLELAPEDRVSALRDVVPLVDADARDLFFGNLMAAGLPE